MQEIKATKRAKAFFVVDCHVRSPALLVKWSEFKCSKVAENVLMRSRVRHCEGIKLRSVPSLEADTSK